MAPAEDSFGTGEGRSELGGRGGSRPGRGLTVMRLATEPPDPHPVALFPNQHPLYSSSFASAHYLPCQQLLDSPHVVRDAGRHSG